MLCLPSIRLASELIVHETCLMISLYLRTERKTCMGLLTFFFKFIALYKCMQNRRLTIVFRHYRYSTRT